MKLINLTPHDINIVVYGNGENHGEETILAIPSSGLARCETQDHIDGPGYLASDEPTAWPDGGHFRCVVREFLGASLPAPAMHTIYIASLLVAQAAAESGRMDVYAPDTGETALRDQGGNVLAVRGLVRCQPSRAARCEAAVAPLLGVGPDCPAGDVERAHLIDCGMSWGAGTALINAWRGSDL